MKTVPDFAEQNSCNKYHPTYKRKAFHKSHTVCMCMCVCVFVSVCVCVCVCVPHIIICINRDYLPVSY